MKKKPMAKMPKIAKKMKPMPFEKSPMDMKSDIMGMAKMKKAKKK